MNSLNSEDYKDLPDLFHILHEQPKVRCGDPESGDFLVIEYCKRVTPSPQVPLQIQPESTPSQSNPTQLPQTPCPTNPIQLPTFSNIHKFILINFNKFGLKLVIQDWKISYETLKGRDDSETIYNFLEYIQEHGEEEALLMRIVKDASSLAEAISIVDRTSKIKPI